MMEKQLIPAGYKQTEVGVIPVEWDVKRLGAIGTLSKGRGLLKEDIKTNGAVPAIPYTALYTDFSEVLDYGLIKWFVDDTTQTIVLSEPCVLIASSSNMAENTGKASALIGTTPVAIGREVIVFKSDSNSGYISYLLSTSFYRKKTLVLSRGTTIKHLYPATFVDYEISLPPIHEQITIANALSDVDALIAALEKLINKKSAIKTAAMQQLLTGKKRLPPFDQLNTGYKQTELGETPGDWEVIELGSVATFLKGKGLPKSDVVQGGIFECIHYGELFTKYNEYIETIFSRTNVGADAILSKSNDVLMPTSDVTPNGLATASGLKRDGVILGGDILIIRAAESVLDSSFLAYTVSISKDQILQLVTGSTVYHLYGSDMAKFKFCFPSNTKEQTAIANVLSDMDKDLEALQQRVHKTQQIKQGMMQELLTGKTRLVQGVTI